MKLLGSGTEKQDWEHQILNDLSFIKKKLRYPMRASKLTPIIFWTFFLGLLIIMSVIYLFSEKAKLRIFSLVGIFLPCILLYRYIQSLKFIKIHSPYFLQENLALTERFLKARQLLIYRHPEAPEVLQIISKNLSIGKEDREVMIFIADDKQVLINSHFTNAGWSLSPKSHAKMMAKELQLFIKNVIPDGKFYQKLEP